ncbi:MAG: bifunctional serine/threonine-protein kinase/formylglycine-generating enzyme family protein, partial [Thermoanaerobaculia bacterium]
MTEPAPEPSGLDSQALTMDPRLGDPSTALLAAGAPDTSRFASGTVLAGRYLVESLLGRGGMGEVYRARDTKLGETVALKLLPEGTNDPVQLRLLLGEVRVARQISHPNVCRVHDVGEAEGLHFMTMEFIEGEDLGRLLARSGALPARRAVEIGCQVCEGLAAAHERGVLHRDLKPGNLLVDAAGTVRLADFGLAGLIGSATVGGTLAYMAPELFDHLDGSVQSDLYALGLVLYELFTGRRAFTAYTRDELIRQHREVAPATPSAIREGVAPAVERAILRCLEKDPRRRPRSARAVAAALTGHELETAWDSASDVLLRSWPPAELPAHPYPVLLPYQHPELLAGRERDVAKLERLLRSPVPILGLSAPSGTGKSSLLLAGLLPRLRAGGGAVALDRHPSEPGLAGRLIGDLLEVAGEGGIPVADADAEGFVALLAECEALAGKPPILVLDQFEDVLIRPDAGRARAILGLLLATTCRRRPGRSSPPCRWLLAYREEYHGDVVTWLRDAIADARREGLPGLDALPHDLAGPERFQSTPLPPLGTALAGSRDPLGETSAVFKAAIEAPLALSRHGRPRYPWQFADGATDRLARAFAEARLAQPDSPLAPELQVVLAHLLTDASATHIVNVPEDPGELVDRALENHLRRAMEAVFPAGRGAAKDRARALLALRELAGDTGALKEGRPAAAIERAVGTDGREILERLSAADTRLVIRLDGATGPCWALSHDRMALAIARLVDEEGRGGGLVVDAELLDLRRLVAVETALHMRGEASATDLPGRRHRQIAVCAEALLWDDDRRAWWAACRKRRRADLGRRAVWGALASVLIVVAGLGIATFVQRRAARAALLAQVARGEPESALAAIVRGLHGPAIGEEDVRTQLRQRKAPLDVLESGLGGVPEAQRGEVALEVAELAMPLLVEAPNDDVRLASLLWALDYAPGRVPVLAGRVKELKDRALAPLRKLHPPPPPDAAGWVDIPAGTFQMGSSPEQKKTEAAERPVHEVTISTFRALDHEVTNAEYRRLRPEHKGADELPAGNISWYSATVYSAWLGGRLPTEAEWEYMARAGCRFERCRHDGTEARVGEVAWIVTNSLDASGDAQAHTVRLLEPNPWGLYDVLGNVWEWAADWYNPYAPGRQADPWGPARGG